MTASLLYISENYLFYSISQGMMINLINKLELMKKTLEDKKNLLLSKKQ